MIGTHEQAASMTGRITALIDSRQMGTIAGEDGAAYTFQCAALVGTGYRLLHVGDTVEFTPVHAEAIRQAMVVRLKAGRTRRG